MKKRTKIFLFTAIGVLVLIAAIAGIGIAIDFNSGRLSGTVYVTDLQEGSGVEDWVRYSVDIPIDTEYTTKLYTNEDDYITDIEFRYKSNGSAGDDLILIYYFPCFWITDDFETVFVFSNMKEGEEEVHYVTEIIHDDWPLYDQYVFDAHNLDPNFRKRGSLDTINSFHIVEVWIRTEL